MGALYTRYPIAARALGLAAAFRPSARASKGILYTNESCTLNSQEFACL